MDPGKFPDKYNVLLEELEPEEEVVEELRDWLEDMEELEPEEVTVAVWIETVCAGVVHASPESLISTQASSNTRRRDLASTVITSNAPNFESATCTESCLP